MLLRIINHYFLDLYTLHFFFLTLIDFDVFIFEKHRILTLCRNCNRHNILVRIDFLNDCE